MINLFSATGHVHYAKSARLYLQLMLALPEQYSWLYEKFAIEGYHTIRRSRRYWAGLWSDLAIEQVMMRSLKSRGGLTRGKGMTDSVRHQWVHTMHRCASVHNAMTILTDLGTKTSEQHADLGSSRCQRDNEDMTKVFKWFDQHEPFDDNVTGLRSLSTGVTADDKINCDSAEEIGFLMQEKLNNVNVAGAKIKRSEQVKPLAFLYNKIKIRAKKEIIFNPTALFSRLIVIVQREDDVSTFLQYELTVEPTSLFKDGLMRKPNKPQLRKALVDDKVNQSEPHGVHVLDGGALMHKVRWMKGNTYKDTALKYVDYVTRKYKNCHIVFDGYDAIFTIKDHEHQRRSVHRKTSADICILEDNNVCNDQDVFLSNDRNKSQFVSLVSNYLEQAGNTIVNCPDDADTQIVSEAIKLATSGKDVTVVADDTDVILLLVYHMKETMSDIYFCSEKIKKTWSICDIISNVGSLVKHHILFLHAWTGCDTTSATFGLGKTILIKKLQSSKELQSLSDIICDPWATQDQVAEAGCAVFVIMYGGKKDSLNKLRYNKFLDAVSSSKSGLTPEKLPPTERSARFHSLRVHLQIIIWQTLDTAMLEPKDWGWKENGTILSPILSDDVVAPELKYIRCKCKLSAKNPCGGNTCSCRKNGLSCVAACGDCRGENCLNANEDETPGEDSDDDADNFNNNVDEVDGNIFDLLENNM